MIHTGSPYLHRKPVFTHRKPVFTQKASYSHRKPVIHTGSPSRGWRWAGSRRRADGSHHQAPGGIRRLRALPPAIDPRARSSGASFLQTSAPSLRLAPSLLSFSCFSLSLLPSHTLSSSLPPLSLSLSLPQPSSPSLSLPIIFLLFTYYPPLSSLSLSPRLFHPSVLMRGVRGGGCGCSCGGGRSPPLPPNYSDRPPPGAPASAYTPGVLLLRDLHPALISNLPPAPPPPSVSRSPAAPAHTGRRAGINEIDAASPPRRDH